MCARLVFQSSRGTYGCEAQDTIYRFNFVCAIDVVRNERYYERKHEIETINRKRTSLLAFELIVVKRSNIKRYFRFSVREIS